MELQYYQENGRFFVSARPRPELERIGGPPADAPLTWLFDRPPQSGRVSFCVSDPRQLTAAEEDIRFLDPDRIPAEKPALPENLRNRIGARALRAVNARHPRWREAVSDPHVSGRKRVHLLAVGDVGGTLLMGLKLLGGGCMSTIGIRDVNENAVQRWVSEMGQVSWPWDYDALPRVEAVPEERLFDCDAFVFTAAKSVPPVGGKTEDVRMSQFAANRELVEAFARKARRAAFRGAFLVMSDPVDPLCRAAYLASNEGDDGKWDGRGLLPEQIRGLGLGVMNARAAEIARREPRFLAFLDEGRSFGPHGQGLVLANSITHYDDALSRELTARVLEANLRIRELGYKPCLAPALSSGAFQLLLLLRGQWHCASLCLGDVWFGCRCRSTPMGLETEAAPLPDPLFERLKESEKALRKIL